MLTPPGLAPVAGADLELTILMPCLNEMRTVGTCVERALAFLGRSGVSGEVVVADNGSSDGSRDVAESAGARVVRERRRGYGSALMAGIQAARGRFVIMADADLSYDFEALDGLLAQLRAGHDLVMGNRFAGGIAPGAMPLLHRHVGNPVLSWLGRLFFRSPVRDFHCGMRGFRRDAILALDLSSPGMEFASEMVVRATLEGLRITEVPTTLSPDGRGRPPHLRRWRDGWRHVRFLLLMSPRWLFLYPGAALMLAGGAALLWLLPGPRQIAGVGLDVNTLVYAGAAVVCGFQAIAFALLARSYAAQVGLMPEERRLRILVAPLRLELGLAMGALLVLAGLTGSAAAVGFWGTRSFGSLDPQVSLRMVAPSATALILGMEVIFASFFLSLLHFRRGAEQRGRRPMEDWPESCALEPRASHRARGETVAVRSP